MSMTVKQAAREVYTYYTVMKALEGMSIEEIARNQGNLEIDESRLEEAFAKLGKVAYAPVDTSNVDHALEAMS